jgi:hypothetical protein
MVRQVLLIRRVGSIRAERNVADAVARFAEEFPHVRIGGTFEGPRVRIDAEEWRREPFDAFRFDEHVFGAAAASDCAIEVSGPNVELLVSVASEVLTRYQAVCLRRNSASAERRFQRVLEQHRSLHDLDRSLERADYAHAIDAWQWLLRLWPDADFEAQVAALFHDVDRAKSAQARDGAERALSAIAEQMSGPERGRVKWLIADHPQPRLDPALALLNDADALSFFSLGAPGFLHHFGREHTRRKVAEALSRMSPNARALLESVRLPQAIIELIEETERAPQRAGGGLA